MLIRKLIKGNFKFFIKNKEIKDTSEIEKIKLKFKHHKIPPNYKYVELNPGSKIIAKCLDSANRSQYIYNNNYIDNQNKIKFCNLIKFGKKLPLIKDNINNELIKNNSDKKSYLIGVLLKVILECNFRIGNEIYKKKYNTMGISTIERSNFKNSEISFIGKKNVKNKCKINDTKLLKLLTNLKENSISKELFSYENNTISSIDVNNYLKQFGNFTTKYFRTWTANIEYIKGMNNVYTENFKNLSRDVIKNIATKLNHTVAICKKNYIYSELIEYSLRNSISTTNPDKFLINFLKKKC